MLSMEDVTTTIPTAAVFIDEEEGDTNEYRQHHLNWWDADWNYLPIHTFNKEMKKVNYQLASYPSMKQVKTIIEHVEQLITKEMMNEFHIEYEYHFGKGVIQWSEFKQPIQTGYVEILKAFISKLLCVYIQGGKKEEELRQYIVNAYQKWFSKTRYWEDAELTRLEQIIKKIKMDASPK